MPKQAYKKNISPPKSIKRKRFPKNKKRNGMEKMVAMSAVTKMMKRGYGAH